MKHVGIASATCGGESGVEAHRRAVVAGTVGRGSRRSSRATRRTTPSFGICLRDEQPRTSSPGPKTAVPVPSSRRCRSPRACATEVDVDTVKLGLSGVAVIVRIAGEPAPSSATRNSALSSCAQRVIHFGQRHDRICLLDDRSRERRADDVVVHRRNPTRPMAAITNVSDGRHSSDQAGPPRVAVPYRSYNYLLPGGVLWAECPELSDDVLRDPRSVDDQAPWST